MHPAALNYVARFATEDPVALLDVGGRDVNGSPRFLFPNADPYIVVDLEPGPNVDIVADITTTPLPAARFDLILCVEVFEHAEDWPDVLEACWRLLKPGGRLVVTCAGPGRLPHSGHDGGQVQPGEWYANVDPEALHKELAGVSGRMVAGWDQVQVEQAGLDVRASAVRALPEIRA